MRFLLLPGMDGTGELFGRFVSALGADEGSTAEVVSYPPDVVLDYPALEAALRERFAGGEPTIVVAESFSGPLGMRLAADPPEGLVGVVLAATFIMPPAPSALTALVHASIFARPPPRLAMRALLVGSSASDALVEDLHRAIAKVEPHVLASRLRAILGVDSRDALARAHARARLAMILPRRDRVLRYRAMRDAAPGAPCLVLDSPHLVLQCAPQQCAHFVRKLSVQWGRRGGFVSDR